MAELATAPSLPPRIHRRINRTSQNEMNYSPVPSSSDTDVFPISEEEWYWKNITREQIDELMKDTLDGTFLVRDSSSKVGEFTLTLRKGGLNKLVKIGCSQGRYGFSEPYTFNSVPELIHFHRFVTLAQYNQTLNVKLLYPVSRFQHVEDADSGNDVDKLRKRLEDAHHKYIERSRQYDVYHHDYTECTEDITLKKQASDAFNEAVYMFEEQLRLHEKFERDAHRHEIHSLKENYQVLKFQMNHMKNSRQELQNHVRVQTVLSRNLEREMNSLKPELHQLCKTRDFLQMKFLSIIQLYIQHNPSAVHSDNHYWLLPDCNRQDAERSLIDKAEGTFLIRRSAGASFALSITCRKVVNCVGHILIHRSERGFGFTEPYLLFPTLTDLVVYYAGHSLEELNPLMNTTLAHPIRGPQPKEDNNSNSTPVSSSVAINTAEGYMSY